MQNKYACDVGDFGKYGLLRKLSGARAQRDPDDDGPEGERETERLRMGIVWYLTPDEAKSGDGRHTGYLKPGPKNLREFRNCDPELYDQMGELVQSGRRSVRYVQEAQVLPPETVFYDLPLSMTGVKGEKREDGVKISPIQRKRGMRREWLQGAISAVQDAEMVFLDPDNGLETRSVDRHSARGPKYAYYDDLKHFTQRGQGLVIYHHMGRRTNTRQQVLQCQTKIFKETGHRAFAMCYHRGSARAFMVIPNGEQHHLLLGRAREMLKTGWAKHFEIII